MRILSLLSCFIPLLVTAQGLFQWTDYLPYGKTKKVAVGTHQVYAATEHSILVYHIDNQSVERLSKVNGLSEIGVADIGYSNTEQLLVIGYKNGNIDLIQNDRTYNIQDLLRASQVTNKTIYQVNVIDSIAFISFGQGILRVNLKRFEIEETYFIGTDTNPIEVFASTVKEDSLFAATSKGIRFALLSDPLISFSKAWTHLDQIAHAEHGFSTIVNFNGKILVPFQTTEFLGDTLFQIIGNQSVEITLPEPHLDLFNLTVHDQQLIIAHSFSLRTYDQGFKLVSNVFDYFNDTQSPNPRHAMVDPEGTYWIADDSQGLIKSINSFRSEIYRPSSPEGTGNRGIASYNRKVYVTKGDRTFSWSNTYTPATVFVYEDYEWETINNISNPSLDTTSDLNPIAIDHNDPDRFVVGSLGQGLIEFKDGNIKAYYGPQNSTLEVVNGFGVGITHTVFDQNSNLWVSSALSTNLLHVLSENGDWSTFPYPNYAGNRATAMVVTNQNQVWQAIDASGIRVIDFNNTPNDPSDDSEIILGTAEGNGNLPSATIYALVEDLDGEIWVGSDKGLRVFYAPTNIFSGNEQAQDILIKQGLHFQILLETEAITALAVDGGDNKWIGTENSGVFLMSPDGTEEIYHFTAENSPLWSNTIQTIHVVEETGEVFIGTDKGLISFKGEETSPKSDFNSLYCYPNPVRPDYEGSVAISGLVRGTELRITDVAGNLVYQTTSEGGQVVWDRTNSIGESVPSGVYMVYVSSFDGVRKSATKLLIARP